VRKVRRRLCAQACTHVSGVLGKVVWLDGVGPGLC
jgi:hypothetical protein